MAKIVFQKSTWVSRANFYHYAVVLVINYWRTSTRHNCSAIPGPFQTYFFRLRAFHFRRSIPATAYQKMPALGSCRHHHRAFPSHFGCAHFSPAFGSGNGHHRADISSFNVDQTKVIKLPYLKKWDDSYGVLCTLKWIIQSRNSSVPETVLKYWSANLDFSP